MKNLFFILFSFSLFITSCSKEAITPSATVSETSISNRSGSVTTTGLVASSEIIIDEVFYRVSDFGDDISGLVPSSVQTLDFIDTSNGNTPITLSVDIDSYEIIIDEVFYRANSGGIDMSNLELETNQTLVFE